MVGTEIPTIDQPNKGFTVLSGNVNLIRYLNRTPSAEARIEVQQNLGR
jgi:hypothetical protein